MCAFGHVQYVKGFFFREETFRWLQKIIISHFNMKILREIICVQTLRIPYFAHIRFKRYGNCNYDYGTLNFHGIAKLLIIWRFTDASNRRENHTRTLFFLITVMLFIQMIIKSGLAMLSQCETNCSDSRYSTIILIDFVGKSENIRSH